MKHITGMIEGDTKLGLSIHENGNSRVVTIPAEWADRLGIDTDERADAEVDLEEGTVTYHFRSTD